MKLSRLKNTTKSKLSIKSLGVDLSLRPGEIKVVTPATAKHPAVLKYIGRGLELITAELLEEPKAPEPPKPTMKKKKLGTLSTTEPTPGSVSEPSEESSDGAVEEPKPRPKKRGSKHLETEVAQVTEVEADSAVLEVK